MSKWYTESEIALLSSEEGLPDNHVITVVEREISIDDPELIQNNVRTDTFTLNLDAEYDDLNVVVIFTKPNGVNVKVAYNGDPTHIPGSAMELVGGLACSVVGINEAGEVRAVTKAAPNSFQVVESGAYDGSVTSDDAELLGQILQAVSDAETATTAAETATTAATNATSQATLAATSANQSASSANSAASSANSAAARATSAAVNAENAYDTLQPYMAAIDSCANILHREVGPDSVVTADDSFPCKPVEMTVYGNTVQNLWVNPSGTSNGVTAKSNADGSIRVEGTTTGTLSLNSGKRYILKPSTSYTISVDKKLSDSLTNPSDGSFFIGQYSQDDSPIPGGTIYVGYGNVLSVTFTTSGELSYIYMGVYAVSGKTLSGTYRVMLNEGSEAEPWCPPGLNSVDELSLVCAGKNLLARMGRSLPYTTAGITFSDNGDGGIRVSGTATETAYYNFYRNSPAKAFRITPGEYTASLIGGGSGLNLSVGYYDGVIGGSFASWLSTNIPGVSNTGSIDRPVYLRPFLSVVKGKTVDTVVYPQLELGSTATAYEPPNITTTPIDLQGHTLNALPDGTRDELHIDGGGNVVLEKSTVVASAPTAAGSWSYNGDVECASFTLPSEGPTSQSDETSWLLCDKLPVRDGTSTGETSYAIVGNKIGYAKNPAITSTATAATVVGGATYLYKLATPQTISLGTITPPTMAAPNVTAYVADDTPAEIELDYVRDINVVVDRLEKKVAGLAVMEATNV